MAKISSLQRITQIPKCGYCKLGSIAVVQRSLQETKILSHPRLWLCLFRKKVHGVHINSLSWVFTIDLFRVFRYNHGRCLPPLSLICLNLNTEGHKTEWTWNMCVHQLFSSFVSYFSLPGVGVGWRSFSLSPHPLPWAEPAHPPCLSHWFFLCGHCTSLVSMAIGQEPNQRTSWLERFCLHGFEEKHNKNSPNFVWFFKNPANCSSPKQPQQILWWYILCPLQDFLFGVLLMHPLHGPTIQLTKLFGSRLSASVNWLCPTEINGYYQSSICSAYGPLWTVSPAPSTHCLEKYIQTSANVCASEQLLQPFSHFRNLGRDFNLL